MNKLATALAVALTLAACKKTDKNGKPALPPPSGEGAKPLPDIPDLTAQGPGSGAATPAGDTAVTGTLQAREQVAVAAKASGTIVQLTVDEGSKVKKGDLLFRLDASTATLMRRQAITQMAGAKLTVKSVQREYDRMQGLVAQNALPQQQLDQLQSQLDGAQLQIVAAQNTIALMNKQIADAAVRSPISGVVIKKMMSVGEYATMMPPTPVVIIQDQSSLELKFHLPERALATLHQGDPVTVTLSSLGATRAASISEISPMVDPMTRTIELTAVLDNCDGALRPGLSAQVAMGAPTGPVTAPACGKGAAPAPAKAPAKAPTKAPGKAPAKAPAAKAPAKAPAEKTP